MSIENAILGGVIIGLAAVWMYLSLGRVAGISGIAANALLKTRQVRWPLLFVVGLGAGGWLGNWWLGSADGFSLPRADLKDLSYVPLIVAGILVGFGTRLGSGCTSGHGICGIARFSLRSVVATVTFLLVGMLTATLMDLFS